MSDAKSILKVDGLDAGYGISQVLFDVTLDFNAIGATAILGMNGAGKTTLLKTIVGEIIPNNGIIHFNGENSTTENTDKKLGVVWHMFHKRMLSLISLLLKKI